MNLNALHSMQGTDLENFIDLEIEWQWNSDIFIHATSIQYLHPIYSMTRCISLARGIGF